MRNFSHINFRYIRNRLKEINYQKTHPEMPWLTPDACETLQNVVKSTDVVLEFGSGRSTKWFAHRASKVLSFEHNRDWHAKVSADIGRSNITNVELHFVEEGDDFVPTIDRLIPEKSVDLVLIDGIQRDECAVFSLTKVRSGGVIILDDSQRYLLSNSFSPGKPKNGKVTPLWLEFRECVKNYRQISTTSGVSDTTFIFIP